jgi:hypothetical protein
MTTDTNKIIDSCNYKRSEFDQLIYDSCGDNWVNVENESITYIDDSDREVSVTYDLYLEGVVDQWDDVSITTEDITIKSVFINDVEIELTKELKEEITKTIENLI